MTASEEEDFKNCVSSTILLDFEGNILLMPTIAVESSFNSDGIQVNRVKPCTALPVCESTFTIAYLPLIKTNVVDHQTPCGSADSPIPSWIYHSTTPSKMFLSTRHLKRWPVTMHESDLSGEEDQYGTSGSGESSAFGSQWSHAVASLPVLQPDERSVNVHPRPSVSMHDSMFTFRTGSRISRMVPLKEDVSLLEQGQNIETRNLRVMKS